MSGYQVAHEAGSAESVDVEGTPIRRQWFAVARADRNETPVMAAFSAFLAKKGAQFLPVAAPLYRDQSAPA